MASQMKWTARTTAACAITTGLNAVAVAGNASSAGISPSAYLYSDWELYIGFQASQGAGGYVSLYLLPSLDGTNYTDGNGTTDPHTNDLVGNFPLFAQSTGSQRIGLRNVLLPSGSFAAVVIHNGSGNTASPGNELRYSFYTTEQV